MIRGSMRRTTGLLTSSAGRGFPRRKCKASRLRPFNTNEGHLSRCHQEVCHEASPALALVLAVSPVYSWTPRGLCLYGYRPAFGTTINTECVGREKYERSNGQVDEP